MGHSSAGGSSPAELLRRQSRGSGGAARGGERHGGPNPAAAPQLPERGVPSVPCSSGNWLQLKAEGCGQTRPTPTRCCWAGSGQHRAASPDGTARVQH